MAYFGPAPSPSPLNQTQIATAGDARYEKIDHSNISLPVDIFRNKIINGDFVFWQRGLSQSATGILSTDRWSYNVNATTQAVSRGSFALGQTEVPGNPAYFSRTVVSGGSGAASYSAMVTKIESVRTLAGKTATLTFYAKSDAVKNVSIEFYQAFGTGGSPSADVIAFSVNKLAITTSWQKYTIVVNIPSITSKILGTNNNDYLGIIFWYSAGSNYNSITNSLGIQSGTFDVARVSLVEGDATAEADPFTPRHISQELALCQRYYQADTSIYGATYAGTNLMITKDFPVAMRALPTVTQQPSTTGVFDSFRITTFRVTAYYTGSNFGSANMTFDAEL